MPSIDGGDQLSEEYAPWFHEKLRAQAEAEAARQRGDIPTVSVSVTWTSTHRLDVPEGMFPQLFADQINSGAPLPAELMALLRPRLDRLEMRDLQAQVNQPQTSQEQLV